MTEASSPRLCRIIRGVGQPTDDGYSQILVKVRYMHRLGVEARGAV
jgi:hypothetical protein